MSKLESDIVCSQDHVRIQKKPSHGQLDPEKMAKHVHSLHDQSTQQVQEVLEIGKRSLHVKVINMVESEHDNTLQLTQKKIYNTFLGSHSYY
jgi:hypothetical protein